MFVIEENKTAIRYLKYLISYLSAQIISKNSNTIKEALKIRKMYHTKLNLPTRNIKEKFIHKMIQTRGFVTFNFRFCNFLVNCKIIFD